MRYYLEKKKKSQKKRVGGAAQSGKSTCQANMKLWVLNPGTTKKKKNKQRKGWGVGWHSIY
jgi:hypothetical protein